ncbi:MAG: hypothetical protein H6738_12665 [Alphaproteobacteria bacterium]|nr:hypothetical protein [Alphaproteobacteria bacterium]
MLDDRLLHLERTLDRASRRLRARAAVQAGAVGLQVGGGLALLLALGCKLTGAGPVIALAAAGSAVATGTLLGLAVGALRPTLDPRELALLVDRLNGTDELLVTSLYVVGTQEPNRDDILGRLGPQLPDPRESLPVRFPRHLRTAPIVLLAAVALAIWVPPFEQIRFDWFAGPPDPIAEEGQRIEERVDAMLADPEGVALPPELAGELKDLVDDLQGGELSEEEAEQRLREMQESLDQLTKDLSEGSDLLSELEQAAKELDAGATRELGEALSDGNMDAAADAAQQLPDKLAQSSPEERNQAAEALQRAGEQLAQSADPSLQQLGEGLKQAGQEAISQPGQQGQQGQGQEGQQGQQGQEAGDPGGLTPAEAQELAKQLQQAKQAAQQMQRDRQALERSQELNAEMEAARQRLGGEPGVSQGEGEGEGQGQEGEGEGQGQGQAEGEGLGTPGNQAGKGHTWEDQGEFQDHPGQQGGSASKTERDHQQIDDFQRLYKEARLKGAKSLVAGTNSQLDDRGRVDELPTRLTSAEEVAKVGTVELPDEVRQAATQAVEAEEIPAAYRDAVKEYFGGSR